MRVLNKISYKSVIVAVGVTAALSATVAASSVGDFTWSFTPGTGHTKTIDLGRGGSQIYDNSQLHIATDDFLFLDAPGRVAVSNDIGVFGKLNVAGKTKLASSLDVLGGINGDVTGNLTGDVTGNIDSTEGGDLTVGAANAGTITIGGEGNVPDITVNGDTIFNNDVTVNGALIADYNIDNSLEGVTGDFEVGYVDGGSLTVDGSATLGRDSDDDVILNGRLYGYDGDPVTIGHYSYNSGLKVWGDTDLRGSLTVGGWGSDNNGINVTGESTFNDGVYVDGTLEAGGTFYADYGLTAYDGITMNADYRHAVLDLQNDGDLNVEGHTTLGSSHWDDLTVNADATFNNGATFEDGLTSYNDVNVSDGANLNVNDGGSLNVTGDTTLGTDSDNDITLNGRLYGWDGDPVTIGHYSNNSGLKVWGDTDLRGNLTVGGWGSDGTGIDVQSGDVNVNNDGQLSVDGSVYLGSDSNDDVVLNGRLYGWDGDPVTIGHYSNNSGLKVWGDSDLRGNLTVGGWGSDGTGIDVQEGDVNINDGNLSVNNGDAYFEYGFNSNDNSSIDGSLDVYGNINAYSDLDVTGTTTLGTLSANNATVTNLTVNGSTTWSSSVVYGGTATYNATTAFNGATTFGATTTHNGSAVFNSTVTANAGVDFSGASSLRVPVTATALVDNTTLCSTAGLLSFSTNDGHFYGCDGAHWQVFDN